jgi:hypothetical protein
VWKAGRPAAFRLLHPLPEEDRHMLHLVRAVLQAIPSLTPQRLRVLLVCSHLAVDSLYTLCAGCGHGAHVDCLEAFASTIADTLTVSLPQTPLDHSHPSTPGIATPLRAWLWGEDDDDPAWTTAAATEGGAYLAAKQLKNVLSGCPAACGHSPCSLMPSAA